MRSLIKYRCGNRALWMSVHVLGRNHQPNVPCPPRGSLQSAQSFILLLNVQRANEYDFSQWSLSVACCSTVAPSSDLSVQFKHGRPVLALPLPSRQEKCLFHLRPMLSTVSDFICDIQREDPGVSTASVHTADGVRIASTTSVNTLLNRDFQLCINGVVYNVKAAPTETVPNEAATNVADIKNMVHMLHTALNLPEHHLMKERHLQQKLDILKQELMPLEQ
ncbi:calcium uniporter protein, mitochondrial-like, partial [Tachysurus ichikawai]